MRAWIVVLGLSMAAVIVLVFAPLPDDPPPPDTIIRVVPIRKMT